MAAKKNELDANQQAQLNTINEFLGDLNIAGLGYSGPLAEKPVIDSYYPSKSPEGVIIISDSFKTLDPNQLTPFRKALMESIQKKFASKGQELPKDFEEKFLTNFNSKLFLENEEALPAKISSADTYEKFKLSSQARVGLKVGELKEFAKLIDAYNNAPAIELKTIPQEAEVTVEANNKISPETSVAVAKSEPMFAAYPSIGIPPEPEYGIRVVIPELASADTARPRQFRSIELSNIHINDHDHEHASPNINRATAKEDTIKLPDFKKIDVLLKQEDLKLKFNTGALPLVSELKLAGEQSNNLFEALKTKAVDAAKDPLEVYDIHICGKDKTSGISPCQFSQNKVLVKGVANAYKRLDVNPAVNKDVEITAEDAFQNNPNQQFSISVSGGGKLQIDVSAKDMNSLVVSSSAGKTQVTINGKTLTTNAEVNLGLIEEKRVTKVIDAKQAVLAIASAKAAVPEHADVKAVPKQNVAPDGALQTNLPRSKGSETLAV